MRTKGLGRLAAVGGVFALAAALAAWGIEVQAEEPEPLYREALDDPPGVPAPRVPGAPRSQPVRMGAAASVQVNVDLAGANIPGDAANEPSIAVDPLDPLRLSIGWRQFDTIASNFRQAGVAYSRDGGRTWTFPGVLDPGVFRSDPVLDYDASGRFYYDSLDGSLASVQVFQSEDQGETWTGPATAFGGDKNWIAVDRSGGIGDGHFYQTWSVFFGCCGSNAFTRSLDRAQTFSTPSLVSGTPVFGTMAVGADGTLFIAGADPNDFSTMRVARSVNAQNPGSSPTFTFADVNLGGSVTLSAGPNPGGLLGQVDVDVDRSGGPNAGNVYLLCSVDPPGPDPLDVMLSRSLDGGVTWSTPVRINDDPVGTNAWQWFGTLSVAPDGRLDVVWNDTRATGQAIRSQLFHSSSGDGGVSWSANVAMSPVFDSTVGWPNQNKLGDYYDMRSDLVGADLAWAATFNGEQDVYYLRVGEYDCNQNGVGDATEIGLGTSSDVNANGIPDECECLSERYCAGAPNSAGAGSAIGFTGSLSVASNDLVLTAVGAPPAKNGVFFYGPQRIQVPFGDGFRCVGGGATRLGPLLMTDGAGSATRPVDFTTPPAGSGPRAIVPMSTWNFQFWYRDGAAGGTGTNLSDAIELTFCP